MLDKIFSIETEIKNIKNMLSNISEEMKGMLTSEFKKRWKIISQSQTYFGIYQAICVDTQDPEGRNRVRFFSPFLNGESPKVEDLKWARPVSCFGGFDDCGVNWIPPAGSVLIILFERGDRECPYYIGTTWSKDRGPDNDEQDHEYTESTNRNFGINIPEFYDIHEGNRGGYLVGDKTGKQDYPPWSSENYNGYDPQTQDDYEEDSEAQKKRTYPHVYGMKTPQKHGLKWVDGDYKCNFTGKRLELYSSCGNWFMMKDDHMHPAGYYAHPQCGCEGGGGDTSSCVDEEGNPKETGDCKDPSQDPKCGNPYFKHEHECRPYKGPQTPQNNRCELDQSGIFISSIGGHVFVMDDSVDQPNGIPDINRGLKKFDFGCTDKSIAKTYWKSLTGHSITMNDKEEDTNIRSEKNGIFIKSAKYSHIDLCDHQTDESTAGAKCGILIESNSKHSITLCDEENDQTGEPRKENNYTNNKAKKAYIKIRSGYGLEIALNDCEPGGESGDQEKTINQNIKIYCPQKDNSDFGPHIMQFQEKADGPGQVWMRVGGDYSITTANNHFTAVGDKDKHPSNKFTYVSKNDISKTEEVYINEAKSHIFWADTNIILMVGKDCKTIIPGVNMPCINPVICYDRSRGKLVISDRVYVSSSPKANCVNIAQLQFFGKCKEGE